MTRLAHEPGTDQGRSQRPRKALCARSPAGLDRAIRAPSYSVHPLSFLLASPRGAGVGARTLVYTNKDAAAAA